MRLDVLKFNVLMAERCMTVQELSQLSGISSVTISKLRNGRQGTPKTIGRIVKALEGNVQDLIKDDN